MTGDFDDAVADVIARAQADQFLAAANQALDMLIYTARLQGTTDPVEIWALVNHTLWTNADVARKEAGLTREDQFENIMNLVGAAVARIVTLETP